MSRNREKLTVVIPAYNEGEIICDNIIKTLEIVEKFAPDIELIAVNDGSKDNTKEEIMRAAELDSRVKLINSEINKGKGAAVLSGMAEAAGCYIALVDADLELNPAQLEKYLDKMITDNKDVVIGCKFMKESQLDYPFKRKVISMGYYIMLRILFHLNVRDTQTGLKLFRAEAVKPILPLIKTSGYAYDVEILAALNRRGYSIAQMPVKVEFKRERISKRIGFKDIVRVFHDTWGIFYRLYFKHYYD